MRYIDRARARCGFNLFEDWFLASPVGRGNPRRPVVPEPERRQEMQFCSVRSTVDCRDPHEDVFRTAFGIFHKDVEISIVIEDPGVEEFILHLAFRTAAVRFYQIGIGIGRLWVLVEILHVGVRRRTVEVEVVLLHIFAMVALVVGQPEESLLENRIFAVPQGQRKAEALFVIGNPGESVFAPTVGARAGVVVGKVIPGISTFAIVLADSAPLSLAEIRSPFSPWDTMGIGFFKTFIFRGLGLGHGLVSCALLSRFLAATPVSERLHLLNWVIVSCFPTAFSCTVAFLSSGDPPDASTGIQRTARILRAVEKQENWQFLQIRI